MSGLQPVMSAALGLCMLLIMGRNTHILAVSHGKCFPKISQKIVKMCVCVFFPDDTDIWIST